MGKRTPKYFLIFIYSFVSVLTACTQIDIILKPAIEREPIVEPMRTIGEFYGGGIIYYLDAEKKHGLICSLSDVAFDAEWSNVRYVLVGVNAQSPSNGKVNTAAILAQPDHTNSAALSCDAYANVELGTGVFSDWYLPSKDELNSLFLVKGVINAAIEADGNANTIILVDEDYWSSTEYNDTQAYYQKFADGQQLTFEKNYTYYVRAIRSF